MRNLSECTYRVLQIKSSYISDNGLQHGTKHVKNFGIVSRVLCLILTYFFFRIISYCEFPTVYPRAIYFDVNKYKFCCENNKVQISNRTKTNLKYYKNKPKIL